MYDKVIYVVKSDLAYYPPCMSQIQLLDDLGVTVEVWFGSSKQTAIDVLEGRGIPYRCLGDPRMAKRGKVDSFQNWKHFRSAFAAEVKKENTDLTLFWFGTAETSMPLLGIIGNLHYVASALELCDTNPTKIRLLGKVARGAELVTSCQITRAYLMRYWWNLPALPTVFPNKPYGMNLSPNMPLTCDETKKIAKDLEGKKFIIYQGRFQKNEYLEALATALRNMDSDYYLVMMGVDRFGIGPRLPKIYERTLVYGSVPAPKHLEITSRASIGLVYYDDGTLNRAFCAPNKIYEYSVFGLPILANKIPGLLDTVGATGAAECVDFTADELARAIERIDANRDFYRDNALHFFENTDNEKTMREVVRQLGVKSK